MNLTKEQLVALLNGRQFTDEITPAEEKQAKEVGLVVVFGGSDDLVEFRGAIRFEGDCYNGGTFYIHRQGVLPAHEDCECQFCGFNARKAESVKIDAVWGKDGYSWTYKTEVPHDTFEILDSSAKYCRGIVFALEDLPAA
jgi:hypothetical protein